MYFKHLYFVYGCLSEIKKNIIIIIIKLHDYDLHIGNTMWSRYHEI